MAGSSGNEPASGFAALLRRLRIEAGLTQAVLAERAGLSLRAIQHLEAAAGAPYPDTARRLADAFGLSGEPRAQFASAARPTAQRRARVRVSPAPTDSPVQEPVIGRSVEMAQLRDAARAAAAGRGQIILVSGEPGIGKSRLAEALAAEAAGFGVQVCWAMCWEAESTPPFWPWLQLIRQYGQADRPTELAARLHALGIGYLLPELATGDAPTGNHSTERDRFWLFDALTRFFVQAAAARPLLLVLEDLHWSDAASVLLLRFFARHIRDCPILVVGTYRDTEVGPENPVAQLASELTSENQRCALSGLSQTELGGLLEHLVGQPLDAVTVANVHRRTGGNPLFARELARLSAGQDNQHLRLTDLATQPAAERVQGLIQRRLSRLSTRCAELLAVAAVLGPVSSLDRLIDLVHATPEQVLELVTEALSARLLVEVPGSPGGYQFSHALVRDVVYHDLGPIRRVDYHRLVATRLERRLGRTLDPPLEELAYHFGRAALEGRLDVARAIAYAEQAGERAFASLAYETSAEQFAHALKLLSLAEESDPAHRCRLLLAFGRAQMAANAVVEALATLEQAAAVARSVPDAVLLAQAALGMGIEFTIGVVNDLEVSLLDEALGVLEATDSTIRARVLARLAAALLFSPSAERRATLSHEATAMARRLNDPATLARVLYDSHVAAWGAANPEDRLSIAREVVQLAEQCADQLLALQGRALRLGDLLDLGDIVTFRLEADFYERQTRRLRQIRQLWQAPLIQATLAALEGRFEDAERLVGSGLQLGQQAQHPGVVPAAQAVFGSIRMTQGRASELEGQIRQSVRRDTTLLAWRSSLAYVLCEAGRVEEAHQEFEAMAVDDFVRLPRDFTWTSNLVLLALTCTRLGDRRRAELLYALMLPSGPYSVHITRFGAACFGSMAHYLGLLAATLGDTDAAIEHFEQAILMNTRLAAPPFVANSRYQLGRALRARGLPGDERRASDELAHAQAVFASLDIRPMLSS